MLFMQLDHTDSAEHSYGYGSKAYLEQITISDTPVGLTIDAIKDAECSMKVCSSFYPITAARTSATGVTIPPA